MTPISNTYDYTHTLSSTNEIMNECVRPVIFNVDILHVHTYMYVVSVLLCVCEIGVVWICDVVDRIQCMGWLWSVGSIKL